MTHSLELTSDSIPSLISAADDEALDELVAIAASHM